ASLLRQLIAKPRAHHEASNLDLCYVTDHIIATSGPSGSFPKRAYRNPLDQLIKFLDSQHKDNWAIWEFRAEGTGYPDEAVYNRIWHYPWPDHHPPPFGLIPNMMASMRDWLKGAEGRVVVVHCKAGKGRSGTASCSYLVSEEGWEVQKAIDNFTDKRMKPGWGQGVSIPSQLRWLSYVDRWTNGGKMYVERKVEVTEIHVYGLRDNVMIAVRGFQDEGKIIKILHTFTNEERTMVRGEVKQLAFTDAVMQMLGVSGNENCDSKPSSKPASIKDAASKVIEDNKTAPAPAPAGSNQASGASTPTGAPADAIFRPKNPIPIDSNDINIKCERLQHRSLSFAKTSLVHVWFNTYFEGKGPEQNGRADDSGVFEIDFEKMDGLKGSSRRGARCFDRIAVVWKVRSVEGVVEEPKMGEEVAQAKPANWQGANPIEGEKEKD
ncbi:phosphatases II, partial [Tothia fuscella]